jgi:hypothetical protein
MTDIQVEIFRGARGRFGVTLDGTRLGLRVGTSIGLQSGGAALQHINCWLKVATSGVFSTVDLLECAHCARLGVAIDDIRVSSHKCAGAWNVRGSFKALLPVPLLQRWKKAAQAQHRIWDREARVRDATVKSRKNAFVRAFLGTPAEVIAKAIAALTPKDYRYEIKRFYADNALTKASLGEMWSRSVHYTTPYEVRNITLEALAKKVSHLTAQRVALAA